MPTAALPFTLDVPRDLGLRATALSHGWYLTPAFRWDEDEFALVRAERLGAGARPALVRVTQPLGPGRPMHGEVRGDGLGDGEVEEARRAVAVCLNAGASLSGFAEVAQAHDGLRAAPRMGAGRWLRGRTLFEDLVKGICCTNIAFRQALRMMEAIAALGPEVEVPGGPPLRCWPTPAEVAAAGAGFLRDGARLGYRAAAVDALARGAGDGTLDPEGLDAGARDGMPEAALLRALLRFRGVGPATAHALMAMRGYGAALSVDSSTYAYTAAAHFGGRRPTEAEVRALYAPYGLHAGRVAWWEYWLDPATSSPLQSIPFPRRAREAVADFDRGRFHEAHDGFEEVWRHLGGPPRDWMQGMVHVAVAAAHARRGNRYGALSQAERAERRLAAADGRPTPLPAATVYEVIGLIRRAAEGIDGSGSAVTLSLPPLGRTRPCAGDGAVAGPTEAPHGPRAAQTLEDPRWNR